MSQAPPMKMQWDGESFRPASGYWQRQADAHYVVGATYRLVEENEQSDKSRAHEFAFLREAWNSLPDELLEQYPNAEVLRKHGLIAKGHCTVVQHACASVAEAQRLAAILKPRDMYAIVIQRGPIVSEYTALSQSRRAMGGPMFQKSKTDLMEWVADLLGVSPDTLSQVGEAA